MPELTTPSSFWKTRQPGKYYTQEELISLENYCTTLNMRIIPEVDMPGHSAYFEKATGLKLQTQQGMATLQKALDEVIPLFKDSFFHIGSDEVHFEMDSFMPEMIKYVRSKGKEVVTWYPGYSPDRKAIRMCWGENEAAHPIDKTAGYIDSNGFTWIIWTHKGVCCKPSSSNLAKYPLAMTTHWVASCVSGQTGH